MTYTWKEFTPDEQRLLTANIPTRYIHVSLDMIDILGGDIHGAVILQSLLQWSSAAADSEGWFFHTAGQITKETHLSDTAQKRIRTKLVEMNILEQERRGVPSQNYYRLNLAEVLKRIRALPSQSDTDQLVRPPVSLSKANQSVRYRLTSQSDTGQDNLLDKSTTESTTSNYSTPTESHGSQARSAIPSDDEVFIRHLSPDGVGTLEKFIAWVVKHYPRKEDGTGASTAQAQRFIGRLIKSCRSNKEDVRLEARKQFDLFREGLKRLKSAVEDGTRERAYIPSFDRFANLGVSYGRVAGYLEWAEATPIQRKKKELVAV